MKLITITPVSFHANEHFFSRDSGLLSRAFSSLGHESFCLMPTPSYKDDIGPVKRADLQELSNPDYWRALAADGVVLYSWALPRYWRVAQAIKASESRLFLNIDTGGLFSPIVDPIAYARFKYKQALMKTVPLMAGLKVSVGILHQYANPGIHIRRLQHMSAADAIGVVSPIAAERTRRYLRRLNRADIAQRVYFVPNPVDPLIAYNGSLKKFSIVAVGRWNDPVKRPHLLANIIRITLSDCSDVRFVIVGKHAERIAGEASTGSECFRERIDVYSWLNHKDMNNLLSESCIALCTSESEASHTASAEALCAGCSIVAPCSPTLPAMPYYTSEFSGTLATGDSPNEIAKALLTEITLWRNDLNRGKRISEKWYGRLNALAVAQQISDLIFRSNIHEHFYE